MIDHSPRYVMRELCGATTTDSDFMVLDRWYCHRAIYFDGSSRPMGDRKGLSVAKPYVLRAAEAAAVCAALNAEHEAWLLEDAA